jgi:hypothetical protein
LEEHITTTLLERFNSEKEEMKNEFNKLIQKIEEEKKRNENNAQ